MALHRIRNGLNLPLGNAPRDFSGTATIGRVGLLADDYPNLSPRLCVDEGAEVKRGQLLFEDRKIKGVRFTAPAAGRVIGIHRGARRALQSVVIDLDDSEREGARDAAKHETFTSFTGRHAGEVSRDEVVELLSESGLWTALRMRPFGKVPAVDMMPHALFVTAVETEPLAPDPQAIVAAAAEDFRLGLLALTKLCEGTTYLCVAEGSSIGQVDAGVRVEQFAGPHPAGLVGLHMHLLAPVSRERIAFSIGYQDVISVGRLFRTGRLELERVISIAGPAIAQPRLVRTRVGACLDDLTQSDNLEKDVRLISGSVLSGKSVTRAEFGYLGRYERQVTAIREGRERELLGWLAPGARTFSILPVFLAKWLRKQTDFTTSRHGAERAMVPIGVYERVMPMDILPTHLLRALLSCDLERAEALGCLELDEEDLALCTFVCPSKIDHGVSLRRTLDMIGAS